MADNKVSFQDLHYDKDLAHKMDLFKEKMNVEPPEKWIKKNPYANNSQYLPIDKTEWLMDSIFQDWEIEVLREGVMFNSVYVTVRVKYLHPVKNEWRHHDGVGAHNMQSDTGTKLSIDTIKDAAVKMALPIAKSEAIKDACDHLGKLFGRDLNRKNQIEWKGAYVNHEKPKPVDKTDNRLMIMLYNAKDIKDLEKLKKDCLTEEHIAAYEDVLRKFVR